MKLAQEEHWYPDFASQKGEAVENSFNNSWLREQEKIGEGN
jgi:hypothetical protein